MNWTTEFEDYILDRGFQYYADDCVKDIRFKDGVVTATVDGSEKYEVKIRVYNDQVNDMYCSCPHAFSGHNCKHMAAVLYEFSNQFDDKSILDQETDNEDSIFELVNEADEATIRSFLISLLEEDERLITRFKQLTHSEVSKEDLRRYKEQVDMAIFNNQDRYGFISYYNASKFYNDITEFLDNDIQMMIDNENYEASFELTNYIFLKIGKIDIDDSGGEIGMLAGECNQIWNDILNHADLEFKKFMFEWFVQHLDGSIVDYLEEYVETIILENFNEDVFISTKLSFLEIKIKQLAKNADSWSRNYHLGKWVVSFIMLMERVGDDLDGREDYFKNYWEIPSVRKYYVEKCIEIKDYQGAIDTLIESQKIDYSYPGLIKEYSTKLKDIYRLIGNKEEYINMLWHLILNDDAGNLAIFKELKEQYSDEEWMIKREKIFSDMPQYGHVDVLYKEEGLYDRLLAYVESSFGLFALKKYEDVLIKEYPKEILEKYRVEVEKMAVPTSNRKTYQQLVVILHKMSKMQGGKEVVKEIVQRWRTVYSNRRAMMDELKSLI
jgi:SWIM zinc finger